MESLNWKQSVYRDDSIKKTNIREYSPHTGINLNDSYSDIHIEIQNQDQFLLPGDSYIYRRFNAIVSQLKISLF